MVKSHHDCISLRKSNSTGYLGALYHYDMLYIIELERFIDIIL